MASLTKRERSVASKYRKYEKAREEAKRFYDRADRLLVDIARLVRPKMRCRISEDGKELVVTDLAAEAAKAEDQAIIGWGHGAVRHYEVKAVKL
jgi:hypothetical protein